MMKNILYVLSVCALCSVSQADLLFKMESSTTELLPGQTVTVTISAWANDALATGDNGLNYWSLSALVDTSSIVEVVDGSIVPLGLVPADFAIEYNAINGGGAGGTGSIDYLSVQPASSAKNSMVGVGGYAPVAQFDIKAIGSVGQSVGYTLGDTAGFNGILKDFTVLDGQFDANNSVTTFTIVPEPATMALLGMGGLITLCRKK